MKWDEVLKLFKNQPIIETFMFGQQPKELPKIRVQLSRWVGSGRLIQIKRGMYALSDTFRKEPLDKEYVSSFAVRPSYISLEYALASYGLIPEFIPNVTLVTTKRPQKLKFINNCFLYRHISPKHFWGYSAKGKRNFEIFFAEPEKALLDLFYFSKGDIDLAYFNEMRLQNIEVLNLKKLVEYAERFKSPKIMKMVKLFCEYADSARKMRDL